MTKIGHDLRIRKFEKLGEFDIFIVSQPGTEFTFSLIAFTRRTAKYLSMEIKRRKNYEHPTHSKRHP